MADTIHAVEYFYVQVPDKPGEGARVLATLRHAGVNLLAYSGFPAGRRAQLDFVPEDSLAFRQVAKQAKWKVKGPKLAFLIQGDDRPGACAAILDRLAAAKIDVTAMDAVAAGMGRWGAILWVKPGAFKKAAQVLGSYDAGLQGRRGPGQTARIRRYTGEPPATSPVIDFIHWLETEPLERPGTKVDATKVKAWEQSVKLVDAALKEIARLKRGIN